MKRTLASLVLMVLLLPALALGETMDDLVERDGLFYKNFSKEKVSGFVYQKDNDLSIPLGMIKDGRKQGEWLEWSERNSFRENLELEELEADKTADTVRQIPLKGIMSREINEYIAGETAGQSIMVLLSSQVVHYDTSGARVEVSYSYYNPRGFLESRTYRKYEYETNEQGQTVKILIYNDQHYLIEKKNPAVQ